MSNCFELQKLNNNKIIVVIIIIFVIVIVVFASSIKIIRFKEAVNEIKVRLISSKFQVKVRVFFRGVSTEGRKKLQM